MTAKDFHVGTIITGITGVMVAPGNFGDVQEMFEHVLGHPVWTHEMIAEAEPVAAVLREQHPDLADVAPPTAEWAAVTDPDEVRRLVEGWLAEQVERYGETRSVEQRSVERVADPLTTLRELVGPDKPIVGVVMP